MALEPIPFSNGNAIDRLTQNSTQLTYDASSNNAVIASQTASIDTGANNSVHIGGNNNYIGVDVGSAVIAGGGGGQVSSSGCFIGAHQDSTIGTACENSAIFGQNNNIANSCPNSFIIGNTCNVTAANGIAMGQNANVSGAGSICWADSSLGVTDLGTANAFGFYATNGGIISDVAGTEPISSALLTLESTTGGLRLPVMTTTQMNAIGSPGQGLTIYNSTAGEIFRYNGSAWTQLANYTTQSVSTTVSGIWAASQNITLTFFKIGTLVTMTWTAVQATANTAALITSSAGIVPAAYRPAADSQTTYRAIDNGNAVVSACQVTTAGTITWRGTNFTSFAGSGSSGMTGSCSSTWLGT